MLYEPRTFDDEQDGYYMYGCPSCEDDWGYLDKEELANPPKYLVCEGCGAKFSYIPPEEV